MTMFLKIFLAVFLAVVLAHFFPVLLVPFAVLAAVGCLVRVLLAGGAPIVTAVLGGVVALLGIICFGLATVFAPIVIPVLLVVGAVALIRALTRRAA